MPSQKEVDQEGEVRKVQRKVDAMATELARLTELCERIAAKIDVAVPVVAKKPASKSKPRKRLTSEEIRELRESRRLQ